MGIDDPVAVRIHRKIAQMIAQDLQPLSLVENKGFRALIAEIQPRYQIPSRRYFKDRVLPDLSEAIRKNVVHCLAKADYISFTTDLWTSEHIAISYMSLTAHWLSTEFKRFSALLLCEKLDGRHTGIIFNIN